jgi:hypothetical protein
MAPELLQWNRNESTKTIGSAADIFSLGATVFELAANVQMPKGVLTLLYSFTFIPPPELSFLSWPFTLARVWWVVDAGAIECQAAGGQDPAPDPVGRVVQGHPRDDATRAI